MITEEKVRSATEEHFVKECSKFMSKILETFDADARDDIYHYVQLLGVERLGGKVTNDEVGAQLKEVISNNDTIELIKNWVNGCAAEQERKRYEEQVKAKAEIEPAKKAKVPEIYAVAKPQEPKRSKVSEKPQEKRKEPQKQKAKEPREVAPQKDKSKLSDRLQDQEPSTRKRVKPDSVPGEQTPAGMQSEQPPQGDQQPQGDGKTKCKFFPFCKKENCPFFHPTEKCTYWPRCKFKQTCMNAHEPCKFEDKCNRPNCYYDHPFKKSNPTMDLMKMLAATLGQPKRPFKKRTLSNEVKDTPAGTQVPKEQP